MFSIKSATGKVFFGLGLGGGGGRGGGVETGDAVD